MTKQLNISQGVVIFAEIQEFAGFSPEAQHYIRRSLEVASGDRTAIERCSNNPHERIQVRAQFEQYSWLTHMRRMLAERRPTDEGALLSLLTDLTSFDLRSGDLDCFAAYRFLYERLLGARAREWLPSAFCAAALLPSVKPIRRFALLASIGEAALLPWPDREPCFFPEQIVA
jgi:hypothetical protein